MIMEFDIFGNKLLVHVPQMFLTQKDTLFKTLNSEYYIPGLRNPTQKTIPCSALHTHLGQNNISQKTWNSFSSIISIPL